MIQTSTYCAEPPIALTDGAIQVISLTQICGHQINGLGFWSGGKSPVAVLFHHQSRTDILARDDEKISRAEIQRVLKKSNF